MSQGAIALLVALGIVLYLVDRQRLPRAPRA